MEKTTKTICYAGRMFHNGRMYHRYIDANKEEIYLKNPLGCGKRSTDIIGGKYRGETEANGEKTIFIAVGDWEYLGMTEHEDLIVLWHAHDETAVAERDAAKRKKQDAEDPFKEILAPIRNAYHSTNTVGKRALLARVIEIITRGK